MSVTNTQYGTAALNSNTSGQNNTALGAFSSYYNTSGSQNTAVGTNSLLNNTGSNNTSVGAGTLCFNISGTQNTAIGTNALLNNTTGDNNTSIGCGSLCLAVNGSLNTAVGSSALGLLVNGKYNVAVGTGSLYNNLGDGNVAIGSSSLYGNKNGANNVAIGESSGTKNTDYNYNTLIGSSTDTASNSVKFSTAIGYGAIVDTSNTIVLGNTNSIVRIPKLSFLPQLRHLGVDTSGNIYITDVSGSTPTDDVSLNNLTVSGNTGLLGGLGVGRNYDPTGPLYVMEVSGNVGVDGNIDVSGGINTVFISFTSDYRIKKNVQELTDSFILDKIRPVTYENTVTQKQDIGLIAHEVQEVFPSLVTGEKDAEDLQKINYIGLIPILIKEIKDLKNRIDILENKK
jgi:hypothetical protein